MLFVYIINTIADLFYICKASLFASLVTIVVHSFKATFFIRIRFCVLFYSILFKYFHLTHNITILQR